MDGDEDEKTTLDADLMEEESPDFADADEATDLL